MGVHYCYTVGYKITGFLKKEKSPSLVKIDMNSFSNMKIEEVISGFEVSYIGKGWHMTRILHDSISASGMIIGEQYYSHLDYDEANEEAMFLIQKLWNKNEVNLYSASDDTYKEIHPLVAKYISSKFDEGILEEIGDHSLFVIAGPKILKKNGKLLKYNPSNLQKGNILLFALTIIDTKDKKIANKMKSDFKRIMSKSDHIGYVKNKTLKEL